MKIAILGDYTENPRNLSREKLRKLGELTVYGRTSITDENETTSCIGGAEMIITNKTPITKDIMSACPGIKCIVMLAIGYSVAGYVCVRKKGISFPNVPPYGTASVGQFAIAMPLELCHHVTYHSQIVHGDKWEHCQDWYYRDYPPIELGGKTMGIIGFGRIGQQTGKIAKAIGMNILVYDRYPDESGKEMAEYADLDTPYAKSDVIAPHCPLFPETQGTINRDTTAGMKDRVIILDNSRGPLVVEKDLVDALNSGKVSGAGLDVVSAESIKGNNPSLKTKNRIITPRISQAPKESGQRITDHTVENMKAYVAGSPTHVVN